MNQTIKYFAFIVFSLTFGFTGFAQRDTISTDKLIIIKQYSPTVNDAFKIKQKPSDKDTIKQKRQTVNYTFIDVPVASTFTPAKGTASGVRMSPSPKLYENYARFGAGNYSTIQADFFSNFDLNTVRSIDVGFSHLSSQGGIKDVVLDNDFGNTSLNLKLTSKDRYFDWNTGIDLNYRDVNYYGLPDTFAENLTSEELNSIDSKQHYTQLGAFGEINFYDNYLKNAKVKVQNFSDNYNSSEQQFNLKPLVEIPLRYQELYVQGNFSFLNGNFETSFFDNNEIDYQQLVFGINPYANLRYDLLNLKLGAKAVFFNNFEESSSDVFIYPDIEAEFYLNQETFKINLGVTGDLELNSFEGFSRENPFISPTLNIKPSDNQYKAFGGFSTQLFKNLSLSAEVLYSSTDNYAFFKTNPSLDNANANPSKRDFDYRNSSDVVYGELDVLSVSADLSYQIESDFTLGFYGKYSNYSTSDVQEAWNLPNVELRAYANYDFTKKWNFTASLFYIGERDDAIEDILIDKASFPISSGVVKTTVDGYLDLNASVNYKITPRLSVFVTANNILNNSYNRWQNFEVQGIQVLGGLIYQFDW